MLELILAATLGTAGAIVAADSLRHDIGGTRRAPDPGIFRFASTC
jgi:hypothetical protein